MSHVVMIYDIILCSADPVLYCGVFDLSSVYRILALKMHLEADTSEPAANHQRPAVVTSQLSDCTVCRAELRQRKGSDHFCT